MDVGVIGDGAAGVVGVRVGSGEEGEAAWGGVGDGEEVGEGACDVEEAVTDTEGACGVAGAVDEEGDVFPGVVGAGEGGVVAVVGGEDEEVVVIQGWEEGGEPGVGLFDSVCVAFGVTAVAVEHIVVDEIGEDEAGLFFMEPLRDEGGGVVVIAGVAGFCDSAVGVDILDFSDGVDGDAGIFETFEDGGLAGLVSEIAAIFGSGVMAGVADEGASDDAADLEGVTEAACDLAIVVELVWGDDCFVCGDLEDGIGGGVADEGAGLEVFVAEFRDNFGTTFRAITDEAAAGLVFEVGDEGGWEGADWWEDVEAWFCEEASDFPMACDGVLAVGAFAHGAVGGDGGGMGGEAGDSFAGGEEGGDVAEAEFGEGGGVEAADGGGEVGEGRGARVAVGGGVGGFADSDGIQDDEDSFFHRYGLFWGDRGNVY